MNREQLAHIVRAAARIAEDVDIVVLGSQSILGTHDADELPDEVTLSMEADIAFRDDPDERKSDLVDGALGEGTPFDTTFGYYAEGVSVSTAVLPTGWEGRVELFERADAEPGRARCLEVHDLVVAKMVAGREKDFTFTVALLEVGLVDAGTLVARARAIDRPEAVRARVCSAIARCAKKAGVE